MMISSVILAQSPSLTDGQISRTTRNTGMVCKFAVSHFLHDPGLVALTLTHLDVYMHRYLDDMAKFCGSWM